MTTMNPLASQSLPVGQIVESLIVGDEGFRSLVYDDQTGAPIKPGVVVRGHPTIGYGWALDVSPITQDEALMILRNRYGAVFVNLGTALEWFSALGPIRQAVLVCMAYQLGVAGLLGFHDMLHACQAGDFVGAAEAGLESVWAKEQSPARAQRLMAMLRTGTK